MKNDQSPDQDLKRRSLRRMAAALVILAGLTGSLVVFDRIDAPAAASPAPLAAVVPAPPAVAAIEAAPRSPAEKEAAGTEPAVVADGLALPSLPAMAPIGVDARMPAHPPLRRDLPPPAVGGPDHAPHSAGDGTERPFVLQLGVFGKPANAEALRARLEQNGIPASIDTRVRVGPFATRAAAEAARLKLKQLGLNDSMLMPLKGSKPP